MPEKLPIVHLPERLEPLGLTLTLNFEDVFDLQFVEGVSRAVGVLHILLEDLKFFSGLVKYLQNRNRLYYYSNHGNQTSCFTSFDKHQIVHFNFWLNLETGKGKKKKIRHLWKTYSEKEEGTAEKSDSLPTLISVFSFS